MPKIISIFFIFFVSLVLPFSVRAIETKAPYAIIIDDTTGTVIYEKEADKQMAPASMSKLMTLYMLLSKMKAGDVHHDDEFSVSVNAWKKGGAATKGSTMFLKPNSKVRVIDLVRGIIIQSGNDACIVVAENLSGTEGKFAEAMNEKAPELGLQNSRFMNSTGIPEEEHYMSVRDIALLSKRIIDEFPAYYPIFSEENFTYNKIKQGNRNPLLYTMKGMADGLKTGHTSVSGYGVAASVKTMDGNRRLIMVVNGLASMKEREQETLSLITQALNSYDNYTVYTAGDTVGSLPVWLGNLDTIAVTVKEDLVLTLPRFKRSELKFKVAAKTPINAPVKKGEVLGMLIIDIPDMPQVKVPVVAAKDISKKGYFGRLKVWFNTIF